MLESFYEHKQICGGKKLPQGSGCHQLYSDDDLVLMIVTMTLSPSHLPPSLPPFSTSVNTSWRGGSCLGLFEGRLQKYSLYCRWTRLMSTSESIYLDSFRTGLQKMHISRGKMAILRNFWTPVLTAASLYI